MSGIFDQIINYSPPLIVSGTVNYKGTWDASANSPTLNASPAASTKGDYYVVSTAGTQFGITFAIGDWIISNGTAWEKVDLTDAVSSVFGRTGAVVGVSTDYSAVGLTNTAIGASNPSTGAFTTVSASTPIAVASGGTGVSTSTGTTNVVLSNSPTIVTPVIAQINDANGNETLKLASIASAVNEISIENAATGNPVHIRATGGDASVGLHLVAKGASGYVNVTDGVDETKRLIFNASGGTTNTRTMLSSTQTVDRTISLPDATGTLLYGGGPLGTPSSGTVTNLTGTASININGTVGATTASTGAFTTLSASGLTKIGTQTATLPADTTLWIEGGKTQRFGSSNYDADFGSYFKPSLSGSTTGQLTIGTRTSAVDTDILLISSTGLAVTGALSATGRCLIGTTTGVGNDFTSIRFNSSGSYPQGLNMVDAYASASGSVFQVFRKSDDTYLGNIRRSGTDNAIYVGGNSYLALGSGDTERMRIDSSGNVGIGSTTPYNALTIQGSSSRMDLNDGGGASRKALLLEPLGYGGNAYARIESYNYGTSTGGNLVINGTGGNVGIGTTSPAFPLDVNLGLVVRGSAARSGSGMFLANDSTYGLSINAVNHLVAGLPLAIMGYPIKFLSSETGGELARIDTSGNVGIGTTSPTRQLQVSNTSNAVISAINGSIEGVLNATTAGVNFGSASNHFVTLSTNGVERARIDTSGNLLVGTTSTIDIGKISLLFDASSQNGISVKSSSATYSNNLMSFVNAGGSQVGYIYTNGTITTYSGTSDYRLKDITGPLTDSGVFIDALKPKVGTWKSDGSKFVGFLAHEFAEVSPSSVNGEKDAVDAEGNPKYQGMQAGTAEVIANLVAELQSLRQRVAALESN